MSSVRANVVAIAFSTVVLSVAPASLAGSPQYTVKDLGTLGGNFSHAAGLNDLGQVTGWSHTAGSSTDRAFCWSAETGMINLGALDGTRSLGYRINNAGQVVGQSMSSGGWRGFVWQSSPGMTNLGNPSGSGESVARGINDSGRIVGFGYNGPNESAAAMNEDGSWQSLATLGGDYSQAQMVNAAGHITGDSALPGDAQRNAVIWDGAQITDLGRLPGWSRAQGVDINDHDQVAGWSGNSYHVDSRAVMWSNNTITELGTLGGTISRAYAINNAGLVTGASKTSGGDWHGFLYYEGLMYDLNNLLVPGTAWEIQDAQDINAAGQIVGQGIINGEEHAFLLTPVPEPTALALLLAGGCLVLRRRPAATV